MSKVHSGAPSALESSEQSKPAERSLSFRRAFGLSNSAYWIANFTYSQQDSIYNLGFKANSDTTAYITLGTTAASLVFFSIAGHLQDNEKLNRWFPTATWGRRAPWYWTHFWPMLLALFLLLSPLPAPQVCECAGEVVDCDTAQQPLHQNATANHSSLAAGGASSGCTLSTTPSCTVVGIDSASTGAWDGTANKGCPADQRCQICGTAWTCSSVECEASADMLEGGDTADAMCADGSKMSQYLDRTFLAVWSLVLQLVGLWCGVNLFVAFKSAEMEIFETSGSRILQQKYGQIGYAYAFFPGLIVASAPVILLGIPESPNWKTLWFGTCVVVFSFASLLAVKPMKSAKKPTGDAMGPWKALAGVIGNPNFRSFALVEIMNKCMVGINTMFGLYFLIFVGKKNSATASQLQVIYVVLGIALETSLSFFWGPFLQHRNPTKYTIAGLVMAAVVCPIIFLLPIPYHIAWIAEFAFACGFRSTRSFWKNMALGLVIDDDCKRLGAGARGREGVIISSLTILEIVAVSIFPNLLVLGMGLFGIDTTKQDLPETPCYMEHIMDQEESGVNYLLALYMVVNPLFYLLTAIAIGLFPLKAEAFGSMEGI